MFFASDQQIYIKSFLRKAQINEHPLQIYVSAPKCNSVMIMIGPHYLMSVCITYVAEAIVAKRRGAYLAKGDMRSAYNMVHINLEVHTLLGISYEKGIAIL